MDDGPRAYYVAQAWLVGVLLLERCTSRDLAGRLATWLGVGIQAMTIAYGISTESGAVDWQARLLILAAVCFVAECVFHLEAKRCRNRN